ncbi:hypothetical protein [Ruminococcus flavefaciens]|uniref:hypothetical protein n=1 Tax=Ruminococcus flavefaciens TaxID=1265 RepID=UPI0026EEDB23|nr:hypothetical protein [Ruminococcus flavefaciens]
MTENERWLYDEKKITIEVKKFEVTLAFPFPEEVTETAYDKLKELVNKGKER